MSEHPKPQDLEDYADWIWATFDVEVEPLPEQYERVALAMQQQFEQSRFWRGLATTLPDLATRYYLRTGGFLLRPEGALTTSRKPWFSFWLKTYRKNVLENARWPRSPIGGWVLPEKWHRQIGDVVRTRIVVRYLDGVVAVADQVNRVAAKSRHRVSTSFEATDEGYYAAHVDVRRRFEIPKVAFGTESIRAGVEVQITTEVKSVVQELLHRYYEESRQRARDRETVWQWDYLSGEFRSSYLGHMAHYLEGLIMGLREEGKS